MTTQRLYMRLIHFVSCAVCLTTIALSQPDFTAHVTANELSVSFPIDDASEFSYWKWNLPETRNNGIEYQFTAKIESGNIGYEFGYYHFKFNNAEPGSGNFSSLIKSGQTSIFRVANGSGERINEGKVVTRIENGTLIITFNGSESLNRILSLKPKDLRVTVRIPNRHVVKQYVTIIYH
ncbi:MAG: hypothetical protein HUU02_02655 [Bacteroidetes bacterium]|nr:hypothetical protein [Bacteroidota bacterium]